MASISNVLLSSSNPVLRKRIIDFLATLAPGYLPPHVKAAQTPILHDDGQELVHEFDDCTYCIQTQHGSSSGTSEGPRKSFMRIAVCLPALNQDLAGCASGGSHMLESALSQLGASFDGVANVSGPPPGYQICLELVPEYRSAKTSEFTAHQVSSMRLLVVGGPLRRHCKALVANGWSKGPLEVYSSRPGSVYFIKPNGDTLAVIYPMSFVNKTDTAIGVAFMQEFTSLGPGTKALATAPSCSYSKVPPPDVVGAAPELLTNANGGWLTVTLQRRHVAHPELERTLWSLCTLQVLVSFHVKRCKGMLHGKMRGYAEKLLDQIDDAADKIREEAMKSTDAAVISAAAGAR